MTLRNKLANSFLIQLCILALAVAVQNTCSAQNGTIWYGELDAKSRVFRFVVEESNAPKDSGNKSATLTSLDEGHTKFPLDDFSSDGEALQFKLNVTKASYDGKIDPANQVARGKWKQSGADLDLEFKRVDKFPADSPKEVWSGTLKAGFQNLQLQVRAYESGDGKVDYFVDSVSQKAGGFKAKVEIVDTEFRMSVPALQATYTGKLDEAKKEIVGKWSQGVSIDLILKRVDKVADSKAAERKRPQTPKAPFTYEVREVSFQNKSDGIELAGTLTIPKEGKSHPLAILISGSGPQDRDETLLEHKPFWVIADHLSRNGIAVLRYDDRGTAKSGGKFDIATTKDFARDTEAAVAFARTLPEINPDKIGLIGHSEGGLIAPMVAAADSRIAWVVLMAGPGVNGEQILYSQGKLIIAAEGGSRKAQERQLKMQKLAFEAIKNTDSKLSEKETIDSIVKQMASGGNELKDDEKVALESLVTANWNEMKKPWFRFFASHEPGPVLEKLRCPVFAINGELDTQVDPKLNLPKIEEHLKAGGNTRFEAREFPKLNHLFQTCKTGGISEYQEIEETIAPAVLNGITDWIRALP